IFNGTYIGDDARGIVGAEDKVQAFISTTAGGYEIGGIGADYMIEIGGCNGEIYHKNLYRYDGKGEWNWTSVASVEASANNAAVEAQVWLEDVTPGGSGIKPKEVNMYVRYQYAEALEDYGLIPYSKMKDAYFSLTPEVYDVPMEGDMELMSIDVYASKQFTLQGLEFSSEGTMGEFGALSLYMDNGNGEYDDGDALLSMASYVGGYNFGLNFDVEKAYVDPDGTMMPERLFVIGDITPGLNGTIGLSLLSATVKGSVNVYGDFNRPMMFGYLGQIP
ncbi:unnamed protein product, partial [marine sediment metagenome]